MRDYVKFWCALETNVANLADFPQFALCFTEQDSIATASGMTPIFGGEITTAQVSVRIHTRGDVFSLAQNLNSFLKDPNNPFHSPLVSFNFDGPRGGSEFRAQGINSRTEKIGFKGRVPTNVVIPLLLLLSFLYVNLINSGNPGNLAPAVLNLINAKQTGRLTDAQILTKLKALGLSA